MLSLTELAAIPTLQAELGPYGADATLTVVDGDAVLTISTNITTEVRKHLCGLIGAQVRSLILVQAGVPGRPAIPTDAFFAEYARTHPEYAAAIQRVRAT